MRTAASIRSQSAVATFDTSDAFADHGLGGAQPQALAAMRAVVKELVDAADGAVSSHFDAMAEAKHNPYRLGVTLDGRVVSHAARVDVPMPVESAVNAALGRFEVPGRPLYVNSAALLSTVARELEQRLVAVDLELAGWQRLHVADGTTFGSNTLALAVRDPVYAKAAAEREAKQDAALKLCGDFGIRSPIAPGQLKALRTVVDQVASETVEQVELQVRGMARGGGSPFGTESRFLQISHA